MFDITSLAPFLGLFGPIVTSLGSAVAQRIAPTEVRATSVADAVLLSNARIAEMKAKGDLENGGGDTYPWVWAIVKLQRPVVLALIIVLYVYQEGFSPTGSSASVSNAFQFVGSWLFSERFLGKGK